jgi:hypothetical protein
MPVDQRTLGLEPFIEAVAESASIDRNGRCDVHIPIAIVGCHIE